MEQLVFGSDPEAFAARIADNGVRYVVPPGKYRIDNGYPAEIEPADLEGKHPVFARVQTEQGEIKVIEDGVAMELTVPPSTNTYDLFKSIQTGYSVAGNIAAHYGHGFAVIPTINYDIPEFLDRPEFRQCVIFGCDKDADVYNKKVDKIRFDRKKGMDNFAGEPEEDAYHHPLRYGGGHFHTSGSIWFVRKPLLAVKMFATFIGNYVTANSPMPDLDKLRVYRYGRPGRFRTQEYKKLFHDIPNTDFGIEYRSPSNAWTTSPDMAAEMERLAYKVVQVLKKNSLIRTLIEELEQPTIKAVMDGDHEQAKKNLDYALSLVP